MKPTSDTIAKIKHETVKPAKEVVELIYQTILAMPAFTLAGGKKARTDPYIPQEVNDDGEVTCGFDVLIDNGSHREFTVSKNWVGEGDSRRA